MASYHTYKTALDGVTMPCAFVDMEQLDANIQRVLDYSGELPVRLGSKSIRSREIMDYILSAHERFAGLLCFTAAEAVWLSRRGFDDLVIAYPTWDRRQLEQVAEATSSGAIITVMADCYEHVRRYAEIAHAAGARLRVCLDMDMGTDHAGLHFGALRTTVKTTDAITSLARAVLDHDELILDGLMGYEGQIAGTADALPGQRAMNTAKRLLKKKSSVEVVTRRAELVRAVEALGHPLRFVNAGGSGSLKLNATESSITEVTAGSAFFTPLLFSHHTEYDYSPAAGYAIQIVRRPSDTIFTCLGGGYTSSGAGGAETLPRPHLPSGAKLTTFEGAGEVQTPVEYRGPIALQIGDPVFMRHAKAGELCERFASLSLIRGDKIIDEVTTYRGDGECFL